MPRWQPSEWQAEPALQQRSIRRASVLKAYEETIAQGYDSPAAIQRLQAFENKLIADALSAIARDQERLGALDVAHERYEWWRGFIASTLAYFAVALSIILFVFRQHIKPS